MYAIRSYYAPAQKKPQQAPGAAAGAAAKTVENRPANADRFSQAATNLPAAAAAKPDPGTSRKPRETSMFRPAEEMFKTEQKKSVITSYSIHYTKLYEVPEDGRFFFWGSYTNRLDSRLFYRFLTGV